MIDYHLHVVAHGERQMTVENILAYCEVAAERKIRQMGITEHDRYLTRMNAGNNPYKMIRLELRP